MEYLFVVLTSMILSLKKDIWPWSQEITVTEKTNQKNTEMDLFHKPEVLQNYIVLLLIYGPSKLYTESNKNLISLQVPMLVILA